MVRSRRHQSGYALLVAVIITAFTLAIAGSCVIALSTHQNIAAADSAAAHARATLRRGLHDACDSLRWQPDRRTSTDSEGNGSDGWTATCEPSGTSVAGLPVLTLNLTSRVDHSVRKLQATIELRPESSAQGVVVTGDVELAADLSVSGSGVFTGGCLRGREYLSFGDTLETVHPELWPAAAAHALGSIWLSGSEIHASGLAGEDARFAGDSDTCTGERRVETLVQPPDVQLLRALEERATPAGDALAGDVLDLSLLPVRAPGGTSSQSAYVVAVRPAADRRVRIVGARPSDACPLTLVVSGNAVLGVATGPPTVVSGAIVVSGSLLIQGATHHSGHLYAGRLTVAAPAQIEVPPNWRTRLLPGLTIPAVVELSDGLS